MIEISVCIYIVGLSINNRSEIRYTHIVCTALTDYKYRIDIGRGESHTMGKVSVGSNQFI